MLLGLALAPLTHELQEDVEVDQQLLQQQHQLIVLPSNTNAPVISVSSKPDDKSVDAAAKKVLCFL
jgi:hypothetical protein